MFKPLKRLYQAIFKTSSIEKVNEKLTSEDEKVSSEIIKLLIKKGLLSKICKDINKVNKQKPLFIAVLNLISKTNGENVKEIFDVFYPHLDEARIRSDNMLEMFKIVNLFLFSIDKLDREDRYKLIQFTRNSVSFVGKCFPSEMVIKVDFLVRIYFGLQSLIYYTHDQELKKRAMQIFEDVLRIIHPQIHLLETTFYFDEKKKFLRMSLSYQGEDVFSSLDKNISEYYFDLIARLICENKKQYPQILKWAEGNLLSVYFSIKKEKLSVLAKEKYINALCSVGFNQTCDENICIAAKSILRVLEMEKQKLNDSEGDDVYDYFIKRFFEKKGVSLKSLKKVCSDKNLSELIENKKNLWMLKNMMKKANFGYKMLKNCNRFNDIEIFFQK